MLRSRVHWPQSLLGYSAILDVDFDEMWNFPLDLEKVPENDPLGVPVELWVQPSRNIGDPEGRRHLIYG